MKALVTGGCGFLGSAVARALLNHGEHVTVLDISVCDRIDKVTYIQGSVVDRYRLAESVSGVEEIYHFAGELGTSELLSSAFDAVNSNIVGTLNVLEAAKSNRIKVLYAAMPAVWLNVYSLTKGTAANMCKIYRKYFDVDVRILRLLNAYGPGQHLFPVRKVVPIFILQALHNLPLEIWGSGNQLVDLVYGDDAANASLDFMQMSRPSNEAFDSGMYHTVSVNELATIIIGLTSSRSRIVHLPMRQGEDEGIAVDYIDVYKGSGLRPISLYDGLKETIEYYCKFEKKSTLAEALAFYYGNSKNLGGDSMTLQGMAISKHTASSAAV